MIKNCYVLLGEKIQDAKLCKTEVLTYKSSGNLVRVTVGEGRELLSKMKCLSKK